MEAIEEPSVHSAIDSVKANAMSDLTPVACVETDLCHKSNGVAESVDASYSVSETGATVSGKLDNVGSVSQSEGVFVDKDVMEPSATENTSAFSSEADVLRVTETTAAVESLLSDSSSSKNTEDITLLQKNVISDQIIENPEGILCQDEVIVEESSIEIGSVDASNDKVTFKTEILVEKNDNDIGHDLNVIRSDQCENTNTILSDIGQGIELSEVLRSSDTTETVENNNSGRQEVFNKEELLDILEGNDVTIAECQGTEILQTNDPTAKKILEAQIALNQLSRLKKKDSRKYNKKRISIESKGKKSQSCDKTPRKKRDKNTKLSPGITNDSENTDSVNQNTTEQNISSVKETINTSEENSNTAKSKKNDSIVNVLVKDWDDDEPSEMDQSSKLLEDSVKLEDTCANLVQSQETIITQEDTLNRTLTDSPSCESQIENLNKSVDDSQPQRRLGRVIKKKVIFDPDNPDTFTKGKNINKNKEVSHAEKEQPPLKKIKAEQTLTSQRSKSKSPLAKMSWKKPQPKNNSKQNKRLTEVDKLLMDEGAVNMIYQLTPEAPKGKKNMKTKAEFIKKLQSSTPEGKEMKFRERKKEISRSEEAKKILGGKQRSSISSSVKSPSVCEDFETHSADDSIIYRRHSSSSYSSTCMSPRRLSDVETGAMQSAARVSRQASDSQNHTLDSNDGNTGDIFMADATNKSSNEIINKDDCLSIKEKLNTKLSLALNKRKRDSSKMDKPSKQKKTLKTEEKNLIMKSDSFNYLSLKIDQRLAEICIRYTETCSNIEMLKELQQAFSYVESRKDISVTLIISECGTLCSDLDLGSLLHDNMEKRTNHAYEFAETVRLLLYCVGRHSKLVVAGVWGACSGVALALAALSDMVLASESATFGVGAPPLMPSVAALTNCCRQMPQALLNDLIVLERCISATEALQGGLVSRTLYPHDVADQIRSIVGDIAAQPLHSVLLKKQLLNLKTPGDSDTTFLSSLEKERDILVQYWTSVEGQEVLRKTLST